MRYPYTAEETAPGSGQVVLRCRLPENRVDVVYTGKAVPATLKRFARIVYKEIADKYFGTRDIIPTYMDSTDVDCQWFSLEHTEWLTIVGHNSLIRNETALGTNELEAKNVRDVDTLLGPAITGVNEAVAKLVATARANTAELLNLKEENRHNLGAARRHGFGSMMHAMSSLQTTKDAYAKLREAMTVLEGNPDSPGYGRTALLETISSMTLTAAKLTERNTFLEELIKTVTEAVKQEEEYCYEHEAACRKRGDVERAQRHHARGMRLTTIYQKLMESVH